MLTLEDINDIHLEMEEFLLKLNEKYSIEKANLMHTNDNKVAIIEIQITQKEGK